MENLLQKMLNEVVVTPYNPEVTSRLAAICDEYAENVAVTELDGYIKTFVLNQPDMSFKEELEKKYADQYPNDESIVLPPIFTIVLSQYIVCKAITEYMGEQDQATASLMVMNYMLYRKGSLTRLILPDYIKGMYSKIDDYVSNLNTLSLDGDYNHLRGLMENPAYLTENGNNADLSNEIRRMALTTYRYHQQCLINKYVNEDDSQPYVKVYKFLYELMTKTPWKYVKNDVVTFIKNIVSVDGLKKTATIDSIVAELTKSEVELPFNTREESSLLLRYVSKEDEVPDEIRSRRLTVLEFGVYLYYELLLEFIIGEYYGE